MCKEEQLLQLCLIEGVEDALGHFVFSSSRIFLFPLPMSFRRSCEKKG